MAPPLSDGLVAYSDGSPETVEQYAHDVAEFLQFAADPHMGARKETGLAVMIFLLVFTGVFYMTKKKVWKKMKTKPTEQV
jgi:ubiquinol-cytochrome c reductase cytochrome c1 subunit